ncbi:hypothetical protein B296_00038384 [Ensete ventricosum]|uniref:Uncharacterized protein n=1 Tax=Ensete ventricosum TaxID=4639 RepID=A0A426X687_ENSVE|nr:hypothetical protein B296_00038384 [Ensete ventricosum]
MRTWRVVNLPPSLNHVLGGVAPRAYPAPPRGRTISTRVSLVSGLARRVRPRMGFYLLSSWEDLQQILQSLSSQLTLDQIPLA